MPRTGIQLCYPFEEKRLNKWKPPYICQPKYDGVRCRAVPIQDGYLLLSSEENPIFSVPLVLASINKLRFTNFEFDGELYCHGMSFEQIFSTTSRTRNLHPDHQNISFNIFDIVDEGKAQLERLKNLYDIYHNAVFSGDFLHLAPFTMALSLDGVMKAYDDFIGKDYEGIIVRNADAPYLRRRSTWVMKFKPKQEDIYDITGYKEEVDKEGIPKGRLGALICYSNAGTFGVGSGLTDELRETLWNSRETLKGKKLRVGYQHVTERGIPRFPIYLEVIEDGM